MPPFQCLYTGTFHLTEGNKLCITVTLYWRPWPTKKNVGRCSIVSSRLGLQSLLVTDPCSSPAQFGRYDGAGLAAALETADARGFVSVGSLVSSDSTLRLDGMGCSK